MRIMKTHAVRREEWLWSGSFRQSMTYNRGEWTGKGVNPHSRELGVVVPQMGVLVLDLSSNKLGDDAMEEICTHLSNDRWLLGLNLRNNRVTNRGAQALLDTISGHDFSPLLMCVLEGNAVRGVTGNTCLAQIDKVLNARPVPPVMGTCGGGGKVHGVMVCNGALAQW